MQSVNTNEKWKILTEENKTVCTEILNDSYNERENKFIKTKQNFYSLVINQIHF